MTAQYSQVPVLPLLSTETPETIANTLEKLRKALPQEIIGVVEDFSPAQLAEVTVAIAANPTRQMLDALPNLNWIHSLWAGVENLIEPAKQRGFAVVRLIDPALANSMAEAALAWTLYLHRRMPEYLSQQRKQHWQQLPSKSAADTRVTVLGLGELGRTSAQHLAANGFSVSGWSTSATSATLEKSAKSIPEVQCYQGTAELPSALAKTDILLVLLPLTAKTEDLVNKNLLSMLPQGAALINFARGAIVATTDLLDALGSGHLRHAVLDVFTQEPLVAGSPLWQHPGITVLPHIAAPTDPDSAAAIVANNIRAFRQTGDLPPTVDLSRGF